MATEKMFHPPAPSSSKDRAEVTPWTFPQSTRCRLLVLLLPIQSGLGLWLKEPLFIKERCKTDL